MTRSGNLKRLWKQAADFLSDAEEKPDEPFYDPVHVGGAVVVTLAALGGLYWLLWTLLVYEGGISLKIWALGQLLLRRQTLGDLGYEGYPYAMGTFEGVIGNFSALILCAALLYALHRLYYAAAARKK